MSDESPAPKPGIVRRGQKKPFVKSTVKEIDQWIEKIAADIVSGYTRGQLVRRYSNNCNKHWRTIDIYIVRARELLQKQADMTPEQARATGIGVLMKGLKSKKIDHNFRAEERLAKIFGYDQPSRQEISGPNGNPIELLAGPRPLQHLSDADLLELTEGKKIIKLEPAQLPEPQPKEIKND